jgi:hypothetical protein
MCHRDLNMKSMKWKLAQKVYTAQITKGTQEIDLNMKWTREHQNIWWPPHSQ